MSYPPAVPRSNVVHHPQTLRKPTQEKGHLADSAGLLVSQGVGCGGNLAGTNNRQHQLTHIRLTRPKASPKPHPCTRLSGPPSHYRCLFPPPFGTTRLALHSPHTAYLGLRSSPRLFHTTLRHVRRFFRSV